MDAEEEKKQRRKKLYNVVFSLAPLFTIFFIMAMNPLPHIIRLIGFIGTLVFVLGAFIFEIVLNILLVKRKEEFNRKTKKFLLFSSITLPIIIIALLIILIFSIYPEI